MVFVPCQRSRKIRPFESSVRQYRDTLSRYICRETHSQDGVQHEQETVLQLSQEQIAQLCPDPQSLVAARQSMSPRLWSDCGLSETAIWGRCQGSSVYEVMIDLADFAYRCNCPSRKRPCRHVLGLLLQLANHVESIPAMTPPVAVQAWLEKRRTRKQPPLSATPTSEKKPVDEAGRQKRADQRRQRVDEGVLQLEQWLGDLMRHGLAGIETCEPRFWEDQTRRMVDAQAPGLAGRVRALGEIPGTTPDWPQRLFDTMGQLALLLEAYRRLSELPPEFQSEIRQLVGWTVTQEELDSHQDLVQDEWVVIGQTEQDEDRLRVRKTWLSGKNSQRMALVLQFTPLGRFKSSATKRVSPSQAFRHQGGNETSAEQRTPLLEENDVPGTIVSATLQFYPGVTRLRARVVERTKTTSYRGELHGQTSLAEILDDYANRLSHQPWWNGSVYILKAATLTYFQNQWWIRDQAGEGLPLVCGDPWRVMAIGGGHPSDMVFEWNGESARLLSWRTDQELIRV